MTRDPADFGDIINSITNLTHGTATFGLNQSTGVNNDFNIVRFNKPDASGVFSDANPIGDVISYKYGKLITTTELDYSGVGRLNTNIFMLDDPAITEAGSTVVAGYSVIPDTNKAYDWMQLFLFDNWNQRPTPIAYFVGDVLYFPGCVVELTDTAQSEVIIEELYETDATTLRTYPKYTIYVGATGAERFVGNLKAQEIVLIGTTATSGTLQDEGGSVRFPGRELKFTDLKPGSEVRVYEAGTQIPVIIYGSTSNSEFAVESSGATFTNLHDEASVDVVIHHLDYQYIRQEGIDTTEDVVTIKVNQLRDRNFSNPS
jgi:hypothetical protein